MSATPLEGRLMLNPDIKLRQDKSWGKKLKERTTGFLGLFLNGKVHVGMSRFMFCVLLISYAIFQLTFPVQVLLSIVQINVSFTFF